MSQLVLVGGFTADMTPEVPVWLAGYSARTRPAYERNEPLLVTAVTVVGEHGRIVLVGVDCVGLDVSVARPLRERLARVAATDPYNVHVSASHTHFGPILSPFRLLDPTKMVVEPEEAAGARFTEAAERAVRRAVEVETEAVLESFTISVSGFAFNRRFQGEDGTTETHFRFPSRRPDLVEQAIDDRVTVVRFRRDDYVAATIVHLACHPVCGAEDGEYAVSSDFVHHLRRTVTEELEGPVLFLQGAAGDVVPARRGGDTRTIIGRGFGNAVLSNVPRLFAAAAVPVTAAHEALALPVERLYGRTDLDRELSHAAAAASHASDTIDTDTPEGLHYWKLLSAAFFRRIYPDGIMQIDVSAVRIGPLSLVCLPFEILSSSSLELAETDPDARIVSCTDGFQGYLPSEEETRSGGYEGRPGTRHLDESARREVMKAVRTVLDRVSKALS